MHFYVCTTFQAHLTVPDLIISVILQVMKMLIMQLNVSFCLLDLDIRLNILSILCSSLGVTDQVLHH
jgi:hypothetical protein